MSTLLPCPLPLTITYTHPLCLHLSRALSLSLSLVLCLFLFPTSSPHRQPLAMSTLLSLLFDRNMERASNALNKSRRFQGYDNKDRAHPPLQTQNVKCRGRGSYAWSIEKTKVNNAHENIFKLAMVSGSHVHHMKVLHKKKIIIINHMISNGKIPSLQLQESVSASSFDTFDKKPASNWPMFSHDRWRFFFQSHIQASGYPLYYFFHSYASHRAIVDT